MSFSLWPVEFTSDIVRSIDGIKRDVLGWKEIPKALYHYTSFENVLNIGQSKALWATCAKDLADRTEIDYGADIVEERVVRMLRQEDLGDFPKMFLEHVSDALRNCKHRTFVACFCRMPRSNFHRTEFKSDYCLGFDTSANSEPILRPRDFNAYVQYGRVIYGRSVQRNAITAAIRAIVKSAIKHSSGTPDGPWAKFIAKRCAEDCSSILMDIIACFKSDAFRREDEWRIVCRPNLALNSSDPEFHRESFTRLIKPGRKQFIELSSNRVSTSLNGYQIARIPFFSVHRVDRFQKHDAEFSRIKRMLDDNDGSEIHLL